MEVLGRLGFLRMGWGWDAPVTARELLCPNHHSLVWWELPALEKDELRAPSQPDTFQAQIPTPAQGRSPWSIPRCCAARGEPPREEQERGEAEPEKKQRC